MATALAKANRQRVAPGDETPWTLWQAADQEAQRVHSARVRLFRHAMIHARFLMAPKDDEADEAERRHPYPQCPICHEKL